MVRRLLPLALLALLPACGAAPATGAGAAPGPLPQLWTVDATLLQTAEQPLTVCFIVLTSLPPAGCSGPEVRGVDLDRVQGVERFPNGTVTTPLVRLVGIYVDGALTVVQQPGSAPTPTPSPRRPDPPLSCAQPSGGWPFDRVDQRGLEAVTQYVHRQPDGGTARIDDSQRILTAPFTGDLERHRRAIAELYDGPVCVEQARASRSELETLRERVSAQLQAEGTVVLGIGAGNAFGVLQVDVEAATDDQRKAWEQQHDGLVEVTSFLRPV